ncbi:hypothetical protein A9K81_20415 [Pseudomonas syringae pv. syringae]|nr:hypothetical protein A9K81_20415 [Pseudomonas syringae pv. syringae]
MTSHGQISDRANLAQTQHSVSEKLALPADAEGNLHIGQREDSQHDGTVIEWAGPAVLLLQS